MTVSGVSSTISINSQLTVISFPFNFVTSIKTSHPLSVMLGSKGILPPTDATDFSALCALKILKTLKISEKTHRLRLCAFVPLNKGSDFILAPQHFLYAQLRNTKNN